MGLIVVYKDGGVTQEASGAETWNGGMPIISHAAHLCESKASITVKYASSSDINMAIRKPVSIFQKGIDIAETDYIEGVIKHPLIRSISL